MMKLVLALLVAGAVGGCGATNPVSSLSPTALQGAPGTANDISTGGQGDQSHNDRN